MRKNSYLIIILFSLVSCYTYQVKKQADPGKDNGQTSGKMKSAAAEPQRANPQPSVPVDIRQKLTSGKNFKIDVNGRSYKVIVDCWEGDSLVAHPVRNAKKTLKFHKNQINGDRIAEKRFSQPVADIITIVAYAGIGVAVWYFLH